MSRSQKSSEISLVYKEMKKLSDQLQAKEPYKHRLQNHSFRISKETAKSSNLLNKHIYERRIHRSKC